MKENIAFLRIVWKEVNNLAGGQEKRSPAKKVIQMSKMRQKTKLKIDIAGSHGR